MRPPELRIHIDGLIVDSFAGGGGASTGIEWAAGRAPDLAINHDPEALAMHAANHPGTRHFCEDVFDVDPVAACGGRPVGLAWFSPDCTFFSKSRGGKPFRDRDRARRRRGLAWVVIKWARLVRPAVIALENVEEFEDWGPLDDDGRPCPRRRGLTFRRWRAQLEGLGYHVELRQLRACDYGSPTIRKRLFVIARRDGRPIVWPEPTHGPRRAAPYRTAAECIDWSIPCPSIFERSRPLAPATMRRIARGVFKFVIGAAKPFIVPVKSWGGGGNEARDLDEPMRTVTTSKRGEHALVAPTLIATGRGERPGQAPRALDLQAPLGTVCAGGSKHALVAAFLAKHYGGNESPGTTLAASISTITTQDHHHLVELRTGGDHAAEVHAFLLAYYGTQQARGDLREPLPTITTRDRFALITVAGQDYVIADIGMRMLAPHELAAAQGFPPGYVLAPEVGGKPLSKTDQIRMIGNSVCPQVAAAIVRAQFAREAARPAEQLELEVG